MSELLEKQWKFSEAVSDLLDWIRYNDLKCSLGEAYRTPEQAALNAKSGKGIKNSLHCSRLAIDLNLFDKQGNLLKTVGEYTRAGEFWESLGEGFTWGGRFLKPIDPYHFSLSHGGVK